MSMTSEIPNCVNHIFNATIMKIFRVLYILATFWISTYCATCLFEQKVDTASSLETSRVELTNGPGTETNLDDFNVFAMEIVQVPAGKWTNDNPPILEVKVLENIVGKVKLGDQQYKWDDKLFILCGVGAEAEIARWKDMEILPPPVSSRWIVYNESIGPGSTQGRVADSPENRDMVLQHIQKVSVQVEQSRKAAELKKQTYEAKRNAWDNLMSSESIESWSEHADVVVRAEPSSRKSDQQTFAVLEFLKGESCSTQNALPLFVTLTGLENNSAFRDDLWERNEVLLFLSERPFDAICGFHYRPVGEGVILASSNRVQHLKKHLANTEAKHLKKLALCGDILTSKSLGPQLADYSVLITGMTAFLPERIQESYAHLDWIIGLEKQTGPIESLRLRMQRSGMPETLREKILEATDGSLEQQALSYIRQSIAN